MNEPPVEINAPAPQAKERRIDWKIRVLLPDCIANNSKVDAEASPRKRGTTSMMNGDNGERSAAQPLATTGLVSGTYANAFVVSEEELNKDES
jgi:hypothetical protein